MEVSSGWAAPEGAPWTWSSSGPGTATGQPPAPPSPDASWGFTPAPPGTPEAQSPPSPPPAPPGLVKRAWQRLVTLLAAVGAFALKFGAVLVKLKYVTVVFSMLVSIAAYTWLFGWTFAVGFVLLILVHEMGHVLVLKRQGVPSSLPIFVPFLGAFVNMKGAPRSAYQEAQSGLAGPAFGTAASLVVEMWGRATGSTFLTSLAFVGFFLNIFNLLPALPLDGGRAAAALHPLIWLLGLLGLVVFEVLDPSPVIPLILVLGGYELWQRWRRRSSAASRAYFALAPGQRAAIAVSYVVILVVALAGMHAAYVPRSF